MTDCQLFEDIQKMHAKLVSVLARKGIGYDELSGALVPRTDKNEAAFFFDLERSASQSLPGLECAQLLFRLLDRRSSHSVLVGEVFNWGSLSPQRLLQGEMVTAKGHPVFRAPPTSYVLYVNNLSDYALAQLHEGLSAHPGYLGYLPCTYSSLAKTYVTVQLASYAIKHRNTVILQHPGDVSNNVDTNETAHDFQAQGFNVRSIQDDYFGTFLRFKPQQILVAECDEDVLMSIRAISPMPADLKDFSVVIEESKMGYLREAKLGKLKRAGLEQLSSTQIEAEIRKRLCMCDLFNLEFRVEPTYQVRKFNVMLEFPRTDGHPERVVAALEYRPATKTVKLITLT